MTEHDPGPIDRLRAANPVPHAVSQPDDTTLEEILMNTTTSQSDESTTLPATSPARNRLPLLLGVAAALLLVVGVIGALVNANDDDAGVDTEDVAGPSSDDLTTDPAIDDGSSTPADPNAAAGSEVTSCVESYSPETLSNREYAFDGTVTAVEGPNMTFTVNEWFSAGEGETITLDHQGYAGALLDPQTPLDVGARALIAGDGGFVWSCGFMQLWTEESAAEWRAAFAG